MFLVDISESSKNNPITGVIPTYTLSVPVIWHWPLYSELYLELESRILMIIFDLPSGVNFTEITKIA